MTYQIINSGSDGNCIILNNEIMLDIGVSFRKIEPYYKDIKIVFISHIHRDHFNKRTIKTLASKRPAVRFCVGQYLVQDLLECGVNKNNIDILKIGTRLNYGRFSFQPLKLYHDVDNFGCRINVETKKAIYITDTKHVDGIIAKNYDLYLIEANYGEDEIRERIRQKEEQGGFINEYRTMETHLSVEQATEFLLQNMGDNSEYQFIHQHKDKIKGDIKDE